MTIDQDWEASVKISTEAGWDAPTCWTCKYWTRNNGRITSDTDGYCRRRAPVPGLAKFVTAEDDDGEPKQEWSGFVRQAWPVTEADDWCGEHELLPASNKTADSRFPTMTDTTDVAESDISMLNRVVELQSDLIKTRAILISLQERFLLLTERVMELERKA